MTQVVVAQRMWQRRGTAAEWEAKNPILEAGEIGVQLGALPLDPQMFKIGNGVTPWLDLAFAGGGGGGGAGDLEFRASATHLQWRPDDTAEWIDIAPLSALQGPEGPPGPSSSAYFGATFDGGNVEIAPGATCDVRVPYGCRLTRASIVADQVGTLVISIWAVPWAQFPPTNAASIVGAAPPAIFGGNKYESTDFSSWRNEIADGEVLRFYVAQAAAITRATILIEGVRE